MPGVGTFRLPPVDCGCARRKGVVVFLVCESLFSSFVLFMNQLSFGLPVTDRQTQRQAQSGGGGRERGIVEFFKDYKVRSTEGNDPPIGGGEKEKRRGAFASPFPFSSHVTVFHLIGGGDPNG